MSLNDIHESVRLIAVQILASFQDSSVIVPLLECLVISSSNLVKKEILSGLAIINSERFREM